MKVIILTLVLWIAITGDLQAAEVPSSDSEQLTSALTTAIRKLLELYSPLPGKTITIQYNYSYIPSNRAQESVEVVFTGKGYAITENKYKADCRLIITISDARVVLRPHSKGFLRTVWMTVHVKCLDSYESVIFASGKEEIIEDHISSQYLETTDDCSRFCQNIERHIVGRNRGKLRLFSFIILSSILVYFAFQ